MKKMKFLDLFEDMEPNLVVPTQNMTPGPSVMPQEISVDEKIDRFFIQYEREASPLGQKFGGQVAQPMPRLEEKKGLFQSIFEADDEMPPVEGGDMTPPADDAGGDMDMGAGGSEGEGDESSNLPPQININLFADQLARLVSNFEMLIDPKTIVLRRAQTYIAKNYNPKTAQELVTILAKQFNLTARTEKEKVADFDSVPIAVGAGVASGG